MKRNRALTAAAIGSSVLLGGLAITDAVELSLHLPRPLDPAAATPAVTASVSALHAVVFGSLTLVLWQFTRRAGDIRRIGRWALRTTAVADAVLALIFAAGTVTAGVFPAPLEAAAGAAFLAMFVTGAVGGAILLPRSGYRVPGLLLVAPVPVLAIASGATALGWDGAHPAYGELFAYLGASLLATVAADPADAVEANSPARGSRIPSRAETGDA